MKLALLNTSIITADGSYSYETISTDRAIAEVELVLWEKGEIVSHVGHDSTAAIMSELLGCQVAMSGTVQLRPRLFKFGLNP